MKKYSVLLVSPFPPPFGGIANYSENLYNSLMEKNVQVEKYDTSRYSNFRFYKSDIDRYYIRILHPWNILFVILAFFDFFLFLFQITFKRNLVVHVHTSSFFGWWRSTIFIILAKLVGKKTVLHVHNAIDHFYYKDSGAIGKFFIRLTLKIPDYLVSLSHGIKDILKELTYRPVIPIYNGVDISQFDNYKGYQKPYKMLFAGSVGPSKGVDILFKALKKSGLGNENVHLTVMGAGNIEMMKKLADELVLNDQVTFTGQVSEEEKMMLFKTHHIFTLPSDGEGQPVAIIEGMASGMAILSTTVGSIPEVIGKENGILVSPRNIEELSKALKQMILNIDIKKMGDNNRILAKEKYSFNRVVNDNIHVYEQAIRD